MKYTRFDLKCKKEKSTKFITKVILLFCCAYLVGTVTFKFLIKNKIDLSKINLNQNSSAQSTNSKNVINNKNDFVAIQVGVYENKDRASEICKKISEFGNPFIIDEGKVAKVLLGIFSKEKANELCKKLSDGGIDNAITTYTIIQKDLCDKEIGEIISADVQILMKLSEKNVKSYGTEELKKWISNLKKVDDKSENKQILEELKNYNNNFPKQIDKAKTSEIYVYIYKLLNKLKK